MQLTQQSTAAVSLGHSTQKCNITLASTIAVWDAERGRSSSSSEVLVRASSCEQPNGVPLGASSHEQPAH